MKFFFTVGLIVIIFCSCNDDEPKYEPTRPTLEDILFTYDDEMEREASVWYYQYDKLPGNSLTYYFSKSYLFSETTGQAVKYTGTAIRCNGGNEFVYIFECVVIDTVIYIVKFTEYFPPLYGSDKDFFNEVSMNYIKTPDGMFSGLFPYQIQISSISENELVCDDKLWGKITLKRGYLPVEGNKLLEDVVFEGGETWWEHQYNPDEYDDDVLRYCFYSTERNTRLGYMERRKIDKSIIMYDVQFRIEYYSAIETYKHIIYFETSIRVYGGDPDMRDFFDYVGFPYDIMPDGNISPKIKSKYKMQVLDYNKDELVCNDEIWGMITLKRVIR